MISRDLLSKFDSIVGSLNTDLGETIVCYYAVSATGASTGIAQMYGNNEFDADGNMISGGDTGGFPRTTVYATGIVNARSYVVTNSFRLAAYNITDPTNVYQINCQLADIPALTQADYIDIHPAHNPNVAVRARMIKAPMPYGLSRNSFYGFWRAT